MYQHDKQIKRHRPNPLDRARETLVTLRVVVFQTDLELNRLYKLAALLASRLGK
jgi:hypothetical protein